MTFAEFRAWAWESHRYRVDPNGSGSGGRIPWINDLLSVSGTGTGSGKPATYGPVQQRRLTLWLRLRDLVDPIQAIDWIKAGETRDSGWLINCGTGIWWTEDPEIVAQDLVQTGFIAVKCGVEA